MKDNKVYGKFKDGSTLTENNIPDIVDDAFQKLSEGKGKVLKNSLKLRKTYHIMSFELPKQLRDAINS